MELVKLIEKTAISAVLIIGITACSSKPEIKEFPKSANVKQEITNLETAIDNSKSKDTDLLAPVSYKEARNSLQKAKEMDKDDSISTKSVLNKVALGQAYVDRSLSRAEENRMKLQDVLVARQVATDARANTLLPSEFTKLDKKLKEVTADIENRNEKKYQEKRAALITGYMDLELAAIKKSHLAESRFLIDEAVKNGASKLTPKTLATTNEKYQEVDQFITRDRHNTSEIETRTSSLLTEARNLEATTATALGLSAATPEETALRMQAEENRLNRTRNALADEQGTNVALEASNSEMMRDKKLNAIYEEARTKFTPEEAEVYKQGKNLVIRLRALEFPKSQAVIKGDNFALLKKVEDVIQSFGKSVVMVEGHTDSTGNQQLNKDLSDKRAKAVKQYLEANSSDKVIEFESKGFGYEKPLASNKTAKGRAQNRRVDVIIEPTQL